jgi:integrase/recombinase XerD
MRTKTELSGYQLKSKRKTEATKFLSAFKKKIRDNLKPNHILLSSFAQKYQDYIQTNFSKKYYDSVSLSFRQLIQFTGDIPLVNLTYHQLDQFFNKTYQRNKQAAWNYYRALKSSLNKAVYWIYLFENLIQRIRLPKIPSTNPVFIEKNELAMIIENTEKKNVKDIFITAINTGMRLFEIVNLRWTAVNLKERTVTVRNNETFTTKNKKERIIPINETLLRVLDSRVPKVMNINFDEYVFSKFSGVPYSVDYISKYFKKVIRRLGMNEKYHFHLLRRSFGSQLLQRGIPISNISKLLGHSSIAVTEKHYTNLNIENLTNAVKVLDQVV